MWSVSAAAQQSSSEKPVLRSVEEALNAIRDNYVTPVTDAVLVAGCKTGLSAQLAQESLPAKLPEVPSSGGAPAIEQIRDVMVEIKTRRLREFDERKMVDACLRAMVANLDRRSAYIDAEEFRDLQSRNDPPFGWVGLELKVENEFPTVVTALDGTPASRSDLAAGDVIVNVDDLSTKGMLLSEVMRHLRGKPKSTVVLTIRRPGASEPIQRQLTREVVRLRTVTSTTTPEGYLHIRLTRLHDETIEQLVHTLKDAYDDGSKSVPGMIVDLRDNPGGLLYTAVAVVAVFLPGPELVVEYKGRTADQSKRMHAVPSDYGWYRHDPLKDLPEAVKKVPLVVIVNVRSAAGAEIVAAALQDHGRARVVGERTSGTGTMQRFIPGEQAALRLTVAKFYRPSGEPIDGNPVTPDIRLSAVEASRPVGSAEDVALQRARALLSR